MDNESIREDFEKYLNLITREIDSTANKLNELIFQIEASAS